MNNTLTEKLKASQGRALFYDYLKAEFDNPDELIQKFDILTDLYFQVNSVINISAIREIDDIYVKHYLDSIYPHKLFNGTCGDIGCGGGFPCLPLALVTNNKITGVESVGKKLLLIHKAVSELHLTNLNGDYARAEDLAKLHRKYDTTCARAVADIDKSLALCGPLTKTGGSIILYKTQTDEKAKNDTLTKYFLVLKEQTDYVLPGTDIKRRLFVYARS